MRVLIIIIIGALIVLAIVGLIVGLVFLLKRTSAAGTVPFKIPTTESQMRLIPIYSTAKTLPYKGNIEMTTDSNGTKLVNFNINLSRPLTITPVTGGYTIHNGASFLNSNGTIFTWSNTPETFTFQKYTFSPIYINPDNCVRIINPAGQACSVYNESSIHRMMTV